MTVAKLEEILAAIKLGEGEDYEFKHGKGGVGTSWAETVSAFANTDGGTIICGIESQDNDRIHVIRGLKDAKDYREKIWGGLRSKEVISHSCCAKGDVETIPYNDTEIVVVRVPPAPRSRRPVFVGKSAYGGTFRRFETADRRCTDEEVDRMKRDARSAPSDGAIIAGTTMADVDAATIKSYRNRLSSHAPTSRLLSLDDKALLESIGGWKAEKRPSLEGLTLAGVLMFGTAKALSETIPSITLTYTDRTGGNARHDHRITSDDDDWGAPNLFNFFFEVYPHLVKGLQKPFSLSAGAMREGTTPFHDAIREALVNALVHTDYEDRGAVRIVKQSDAFRFENPGRFLAPLPQIIAAKGEIKNLSDIRNQTLARMFAKLGFAEKEGYGYPTIYRAWDDGKRHTPMPSEDMERNVVSVTLPLMSQISEGIEAALCKHIGPEYSQLSSLDKDILLHAMQFGETTSESIAALRKDHKVDVSTRLRVLVTKGYMTKVSDRPPAYAISGSMAENQGAFEFVKPAHPPHDGEGVQAIRDARAATRERVEAAIIAFCRDEYKSSREIAAHLGRTLKRVRETVGRMADEGKLKSRHPRNSGLTDQGYRSSL